MADERNTSKTALEIAKKQGTLSYRVKKSRVSYLMLDGSRL